MSKSFCDCLIKNDWPCVKKDINKYLNTIDKNTAEDSISAGFKQWLLKNDCIKEVNILPGMVRTDPPIKQFELNVKTPSGTVGRTIGIQISKTILKAHIY